MATNLEFIKSASGTDVNTLSITDCFSDKYDVYKVVGHTADYRTTGTGVISLRHRLIDSGGSVISDNEYDSARLLMKAETSFDNDKFTSLSYMYDTIQLGNYENGGSVNYVFNPNDSSSYTFMLGQGAGGYDTANNRFRGVKQIGVHKVAEQITGLNIFSSNGSVNFDLTVSVYGVK
jgi:hypothetical protein